MRHLTRTTVIKLFGFPIWSVEEWEEKEEIEEIQDTLPSPPIPQNVGATVNRSFPKPVNKLTEALQ